MMKRGYNLAKTAHKKQKFTVQMLTVQLLVRGAAGGTARFHGTSSKGAELEHRGAVRWAHCQTFADPSRGRAHSGNI